MKYVEEHGLPFETASDVLIEHGRWYELPNGEKVYCYFGSWGCPLFCGEGEPSPHFYYQTDEDFVKIVGRKVRAKVETALARYTCVCTLKLPAAATHVMDFTIDDLRGLED